MNSISVAFSICFLMTSLWGCRHHSPKAFQTAANDAQVVPVQLAPIRRVVRTEPILASGLVASAQEARLSFKMGGTINQLLAQEGQFVHKGQLLATLTVTELDAQVNQVQLASEKAERDFKRVQRLYADSAATLEQVQNATTGLQLARQNRTLVEDNRKNTHIYATIDGIITKKLANVGEVVMPGGWVYLLSSNRQQDWVVRVAVSDKNWARLQPGSQASLSFDAYPHQRFRGIVSRLAQAANPVTKQYEVDIRLKVNGIKLAPGLFADVTLTPLQCGRYTQIPLEAIVEGNGKEGFVYVLPTGYQGMGPFRVRKTPVQIGFLDGENVLLATNLARMNVVTAGAAFLTEESNVVVK